MDDIAMEFVQNELDEANEKIEEAMNIIIKHGGHDGEHHKEWCIDQVFRILSGDEYDETVNQIRKDGWDWKEGIAP